MQSTRRSRSCNYYTKRIQYINRNGIIEIVFYDYKIRMTTIDGIRMYLVSDLLRQYNEKHGTNKRFKNYLDNKQSQEVVEELSKSVGSDPSLPSNGSQDDQKTGRSKSIFPSNDYHNGKFDIPGVIQYAKTTSFDGANKSYIVCEELLYACLMWTDPAFACDVLRFITRLR